MKAKQDAECAGHGQDLDRGLCGKALVEGNRLVGEGPAAWRPPEGLDKGLRGKALVKGNGLVIVGEGLDNELRGKELEEPMVEGEREDGVPLGICVDAADDADGEAHEHHEERHGPNSQAMMFA